MIPPAGDSGSGLSKITLLTAEDRHPSPTLRTFRPVCQSVSSNCGGLEGWGSKVVEGSVRTKRMQLDGTNTTYLSNVVNRHYGCNFKMMVNRYRVTHAKEMLAEGDISFADLPGHCGFASRSTFYEVFKRIEGITPTQYLRLAGTDKPDKEGGTGEENEQAS